MNFLSSISAGLAAVLGFIAGMLIVGIVLIFYFNGLHIETRWFTWTVYEGQVDKAARLASRTERDRCNREKEQSLKDAREEDAREAQRRAADFIKQLEQVNAKAEQYRSERDAFESQVKQDQDDEQANAPPGDRIIYSCNVGPRGAAGLQQRNLPYPSAGQPAN